MRMNNPATEVIPAPKPEARPRLYARSIDDKARARLSKVERRVSEQLHIGDPP